MKKRAFHHMLLILLVTCLLTTGCSQPSGDAPISGTGYSSSTITFTIVSSTATSRIQYGEDLEVTIGFKLPTARHLDRRPIIRGKIVMEEWTPEINLGSTCQKSMIVKEYDSISEDLYQEYYFDGILYSAMIETIRVPADWFSETTGTIKFCVYIWNSIWYASGFTIFCYAKDLFYFPNKSDSIQLFGSRYDFNNRNKPWRWFEWKNTEDESLPIY